MKHWEDEDARAFWNWAMLVPVVRDCLYHVANGGKRSRIEAAIMQGLGVRAGVSDYHLPVPRWLYHGLWIELKATRPHDSGETPAQKRWRLRMREQGYAAYVARGWEEAAQICRWYMGLPVPEHWPHDQPDLEEIRRWCDNQGHSMTLRGERRVPGW